MIVFLGLLVLVAVVWVAWATLRTDVKIEAVSRDLEAAMTEEAIQRVKDSIKIKREQWRDEYMKG